jgi:DNA transformation protein and related proteins
MSDTAMAAAPTPPFVLHCLELLEPLGPARAKRMFGGFGLYVQELFIALIADEQLYLKTDATTRPRFEAEGGTPFTFVQRDRAIEMSYLTPPAEALDAPALMEPWARLALEAAIRARAAAAASRPARPRRAAPRKTARR